MSNYTLSEQRVQPVSNESTATSSALPTQSSQQAANMPYCANHQVEYLHLQAELDALLQQLQSLKQQRLAAEADSTPALAIR